MPPPMNSKDAKIPKVDAKVALAVPESHIIILGNKNIKPTVIPMRKMEHRITQLNTLLWQFRRLGTSPSSKPSKALTIASISSSLTIASRSSCCCILIAACCMSRVCCEEFSIFCGIRCNLVMYNALLSRWLLDSMNRRDAITPDGYSMARVRNYYSTWMRTRGNNSLQLVGAVPSPESRVARRDTRHATADLGTVCAYDTVWHTLHTYIHTYVCRWMRHTVYMYLHMICSGRTAHRFTIRYWHASGSPIQDLIWKASKSNNEARRHPSGNALGTMGLGGSKSRRRVGKNLFAPIPTFVLRML